MAWKLIVGVAMCATLSASHPISSVVGRRLSRRRGSSTFGFAPTTSSIRLRTSAQPISVDGSLCPKFICSVRFLPVRPETLRARIIYAGTVVTSYTARITDKRLQIFSIADDLGTTALPNGAWRWSSLSAPRKRDNLSERRSDRAIVGAAVCVGSDVIRRIGTATCRSDESACGFAGRRRSPAAESSSALSARRLKSTCSRAAMTPIGPML